ncbi:MULTISPECIES: S41 family peptidase [Aliarcobacter]|mgnify:FL=1|jgi:carboxyl-terminal processing protease|uniref:S41 family peptidase n=5 Tax=Arcobacteraceae TaxID=2808963 RepID=A0A7G9LGT9_9BACT|nr:S41 family peptidase [Aliarcobacter cryaerophilus]NCB10463.1 S41 family peptidase [Erysipelotrichia bacterium]OQA75550.1 MAG: Carboxy-terminal processing protease CtpB precursor [Candidatus Dependentiae bacterium ADurb.Bin246]WNL12145.1 S41 family peptidase [Arcobacter sp. AZ-2023]WPD05639.1 S41 family peptidase [Arcobacter sp. DSM 115956]WPD07731.1 S41 family peptidase [Arcobacter sp. DSM 115955]WPD10760.1 S41 family peptidase [Arcobacter sp. DSM 115954]
MNKLLIATSIAFVLSQNIFAKEAPVENEQTRFESLSKLTKVIGTVEKYYVDDIKLQEIVDKALKGLMQELDAHSSYLDKKASKEMSIATSGEFGGLGITVGMRDGALTVISPIDDTPAFKAGVKSGDIILKINETSTIGITLDEAVNMMRGEPKSDIKLTIVRKGDNKPLEIAMKRDIIKVQSVFAKKIEGENLLYLRISSFDTKVTNDLEKAIKENKDVKGIVLDLRNNPGGLLNQAIGVVDLFVKNGVIVSQKGRDASDEEKFEASKFGTKTDLPLVVLVNEGSASASEIVSGALQDHKRAILVGEKTFGKGSVQAVLPIDNEKTENIKLTIAKYYLPSGRTIQAEGVTPDIIASAGKVVQSEENGLKIKEADLKKHLEGELNKVDDKLKAEEKAVKDETKKIISKDDLQNDNQLNTSLAVLKSLIIMNK